MLRISRHAPLVRVTTMRVAIAAMTCLLLAGFAHAASPLGIGTAEPSYQPTGGPLAHLLVWINTHQQAFYRSLTTALKAMREDPWALTSLVGLSFAYGIFHAAGPGHGKAVISSYLLANEIELRRGILVSFVSAFLQALVAITVVSITYMLLRGTSISMTNATQTLEIASYAMIVAFGVWLLVRKLKASFASVAPSGSTSGLFAASDMPASGSVTASLFSDPVEASAERTSTGSRFRAMAVAHDHDALAPGSVCHECGIAHLPDPSLVGGSTFSLRDAWSAVIAVGMRPCSGALLVMTFSLLNGLLLGGILSVLAMALGTAITVSVLASLAVGAKSVALKLSGPGSRRAGIVASSIEVGAALLVILLGALLLAASLTA